MRFDCSRFWLASDQCNVASISRVGFELLGQMGFRRRRTREDDQPGCIAIDSMHGPHFFAGSAEHGRQKVGEGDGQVSLPTFAKLRRFLRMPHCRQTGRLVDDRNRVIRVYERRLRAIITRCIGELGSQRMRAMPPVGRRPSHRLVCRASGDGPDRSPSDWRHGPGQTRSGASSATRASSAAAQKRGQCLVRVATTDNE